MLGRDVPGHAEQTETAPDSSWLAAVSALSAEGEGWYNPHGLPAESPQFLYRMLAPAWAEGNQLYKINYLVAAELATRIRDDDRFVENRAEFERLTDRTIDSPNRSARLHKYIVDAINGLPDGSDTPLLDQIISAQVGYPVALRPTNELVETAYRHSFGWGPLEHLMTDHRVTEIMVNRHDGIFVERTIPGEGSKLSEEPIAFESRVVLERFVDRLVEQAGKSLNFTEPTVDMSLPDGSRVNMTISPISLSPTITIRRKREQFYSLDELHSFGAFSDEMLAFMRDLNVAGANMITYGATGSGKTTLLTALIDDKIPTRRLVIIEDTAEINIDPARHPNAVSLLTNEHRQMRALVKNSLRMRPDHLIVGETRDATAYDLIQAFNSGQTGSISTVHARDPQSALVRLTNLVRESEASPTEEPARGMVAEAIHILVFATRRPDGSRRIWRIDEVRELSSTFDFEVENVFMGERRGMDGEFETVEFVHNPEYVMGAALAGLFRTAGLDPDRWTGAEAKRQGLTAANDEE